MTSEPLVTDDDTPPRLHPVKPPPMQDISFARKLYNRIGLLGFNLFFTYFPSHHVRQAYLRLFGATIGKDSSIFRGTTILDIGNLTIGEACSIGFRCMLDARGGITIGDNVVLASDVHIIGGYHDHNDPSFAPILEPCVIEDYVWVASRSTILSGVTLGRGAVVGGCSMVRGDVGPLEVVAGVPAKVLSTRNPDALQYRPKYRPLFY
ncbi:acyltransferase [Mycobacterium sp. M26]|uniref:acyltransferase n=1 Tax=Mycobacterium sp. M26 TaxID=1762962 RepID=UPI00073F2E1F|nr:acyltransferase [Mycobacterium sp. M26]